MMDFIRRFIEQKVSTATGADVRLGKLSFSPISGVVDARDLSVGTFLTVRKIEAKIAVARALKQEIVVRSLTIEGPAITITRSVDGKLNLPPKPPQTPRAQGKEANKSWEFEAHKVLVLDGRVAFEDASGYALSLEKLNGSVEMKSPDQTEFVFAAESFGRRDRAVDLGEARLLGKHANGLGFTLTAGSLLDLHLQNSAENDEVWDGEIILAMSLAKLLELLPSAIRLPITTVTGDARLSAAGSFNRTSETVSLQRFELRTGPVTVC